MEGSRPSETDWWQRHENHVAAGQQVDFDLFVRSLGAPIGTHRRQSTVFDRIEALEGPDVSTRVRVWGDAVCLSECCDGRRSVASLREDIATCREWAAEKRAVSLPFERRRVRSSVTDDRYDVLDLPTMCLAVSVDADLEAVVPATIGDDHWTVDAYLDWFQRVRETVDGGVLADA